MGNPFKKKFQEHRELNFQGTSPGKVLFET